MRRASGKPMVAMATRIHGMLYGVLTLAFLCLNGPLVRQMPQLGGYWSLGLCVLLLVVAVSLRHQRGMNRRSVTAYELVLFIYLLLLVGLTLIHYAGLAEIPGTQIVNAAGTQAMRALKQERAYALMYLFFPLMLIVQMEMQRVVSLHTIIRLFALAVFLSLSVAVYQNLFDMSFMHNLLWRGRYEGLAIDPNALALTSYLLLPFLIIGLYVEKSSAVRFCYVLLLGMAGTALLGTGSRTGTVGGGLLLVLVPWVIAASARGMKLHWRVGLGMLPLVLLLSAYLLSPKIAPTLGNVGKAGLRLEQTWKKVQAGGLQELYFKGEKHSRGEYFILSRDLIRMAPWGGWGPAGFYRESSNMHLRLYEWKGEDTDSPVDHYLMIATDFGIPIAVVNVMLILLPLGVGWIAFRKGADLRSRFALGLLIASNTLFLFIIFLVPPSYFPGVCWAWTAHLGALLVMAERREVVVRQAKHAAAKLGVAAMAILLLLATAYGGYQTSFGKYGYTTLPKNYWWKQH